MAVLVERDQAVGGGDPGTHCGSGDQEPDAENRVKTGMKNQ